MARAERTESDCQIVRIGRDAERGEHVARHARCLRCGWEGLVIRIMFSRIIPPCKRCGYMTEAIR